MHGRFVINGNIGNPTAFAERTAQLMRTSCRGRPPRVVMITAAWAAGELGEAPLRAALNSVGIDSRWEGGFDQQIRNLCVWHHWQDVLAHRPALAAEAAALIEVEEATRRFYVDKTSFLAKRLRNTAAACRRLAPGFRLGSLPLAERDALRDQGSLSARDLYVQALTREIVADLEDLRRNDARMLLALAEAESALAERTGLRFDPLWARRRAEMEQLLLDADAIVIPGGEPGPLLGSLRFFDLRPALAETLRRGASFFSISAGSLVLGERIIVYDDFSPHAARREFRLYDRGLGLVGGLQLLPHCDDRIQTEDSDNLAYLSRRFSSHLCAGLNAESFLLAEPGRGLAHSIGEHDGVYVFGPDGVKWRYHRGEQIPMDG
jgi:peptidase E